MKAALLFLCLIAVVYASSHSEAPGTAKAPQSDVTDFYMFRSYETGREDNIIFVMNANPLQNPYGGPNYFSLSDDHFYEIYVDNNGDGEEDITFQFYYGNTMGGEFGDVPFINDEDDCVLNQNPRLRSLNPKPLTIQKHKGITVNAGGQQTAVPLKFVGPVTAGDNSNLNWNEWYYINYITGDRTYGTRRNITEAGTRNYQFTKPFDNAGDKTFPDYHNYARQYIYDIDIPDCNRPGRVFVGQRKESFSVNLGGIFDLVNFVPVEGFVANDDRNNAVRDKNIDSFVLEVPIECLLDNSDVIGAWTGVRQLHHGGDAHVPGKQVSRLGNPLVNEVVIGLPDKGKFNLAEPFQDTMFGNYVLYPSMPELLNALFLDTVNGALSENYATIAPTKFPRNDLAVAFLTGIPGLNAHPNRGDGLYEYLRLNTTIEPLAKGFQQPLGVLANDAAGYPNGRRPGDDVVDIALRCLMGVLCTLDNPDVFGCTSADANTGGLPYSDGAPVDDSYFDDFFPFLLDPLPGYVASQTIVPNS